MSKADKTHFVGKQAVHKGNHVHGCGELTVQEGQGQKEVGERVLCPWPILKKSAVMDFTCGTSHFTR